MDNTLAPSHFVKMENTGNQLLAQISKRNFRIFTGQGDHSDCRVPPRSPKQGGRHAVTNREGFKRLLKNLVELRYRPFCFQSTLSSFNLCGLKTGYIQQRQGCFSNEFDMRKNICFPHIFSNKHTLTQSFERSRNVNFDNTSVESPVLVPSVTEALDSKPFDFTQNTRFIRRPKQGTSSSNNKRKPTTYGMDSFKERLYSEGISKESDTITYYESSRRKLVCYRASVLVDK